MSPEPVAALGPIAAAPRGGRGRRLALIFAAWTALGLFFFSQDVSRYWYWGLDSSLRHPALLWMASVWLLAALTPLMLRLGERWPLDRAGAGRRLGYALFHAGAGLVIALFHVVVISALVKAEGALGPLTPPTYRATVMTMLLLALHNNVLAYWTVIGVQHAARAWRLAQEREKAALRLEAQAAMLAAQLSRSRLAALKAQLQPHFLFNTLNAITVLVRQRQAEQAEETLARLADLLRLVLDDVDASEVSLRRELEYVERYLAIEQLRFADRLRVELEVEPGVLGAAVPHLGLQPLVENAIRHGIGGRAEAGLVRVVARRAQDRLQIEVVDDGPGPSLDGAGPPGDVDEGAADAALGGAAEAAPAHEGRGIGLHNTRARLRQLYGARAELSLARAPAGGAVVTMSVPFHLAAELPS